MSERRPVDWIPAEPTVLGRKRKRNVKKAMLTKPPPILPKSHGKSPLEYAVRRKLVTANKAPKRTKEVQICCGGGIGTYCEIVGAKYSSTYGKTMPTATNLTAALETPAASLGANTKSPLWEAHRDSEELTFGDGHRPSDANLRSQVQVVMQLCDDAW